MKILTCLLLLSASSLIFADSTLTTAGSDDIALKLEIEAATGGKDYEWKTSTSCYSKRIGKDAVYPSLKAVSYFVCPDATISHVQPDSTGYNGWEGYCGQTAVSNVTSMLCERHMSPKSNDYYGTDATPGQHSSTMESSLRKIFKESPSRNTCPKVSWDARKNWSGLTFLKSVKGDLFGSTKKVRRFRTETTYVNVTPTPVLLNSGGLNYHWVTVVDIIDNKKDFYGCDVVVNTWGNQKSLTCTNFVSYADHSGLGERVSLGFD